MYWNYGDRTRQHQHIFSTTRPNDAVQTLTALEQTVDTFYIQQLPHSSIVAPNVYCLPQQDGKPSQSVYVYPLNSRLPGETYGAAWCSQVLSPPALERLGSLFTLLDGFLQTRQTNQQQADRLNTIQTAFQRSRHQLRQPLSLIRLYADNLAAQVESTADPNTTPVDLHTQIGVIQDTAGELSENLAQFFSLHEHPELRWQRVALHQVILEVVEMLAEQWRSRHLIIQVPETPLVLWGDRWRLKQVIKVLLENAIAFSPPQGQIIWQWQLASHQIRVKLRDQGPGITLDQREEIFKPFYSQRSGGTGLGLAIAQDIVRQHYGHLWAQNHPQGGAEFCLILPNPEHNAMGILGEFRL